MRLHAVSALGRVYANGGSGLGEDAFGDRDEAPAIVKRTAGIIEEINKNGDAAKGRLEQIARQDSDDDIRRVAVASLRGHDGRRQ